MAHTWMIVLVLALYYYVPAFPAAVQSRNLAQFANMIYHKGYNPFDYNGYGCSCGAGSYGPRALDETDMCCQIHDACYGRISGGWFGCYPKLVMYTWEEPVNGSVVCIDEIDTCDRNACECDKAVVDCYERHRSTYNVEYLNMTSLEKTKICNA